MDQHEGKSINGAPSQYDRWLSLVNTELAQVDGRSFSALLAFAAEYGHLIQYYNLQNQPDGDWSPFFQWDPLMVTAAVTALDTARLEAEFLEAEATTRADTSFTTKLQAFQRLFDRIVALARTFNSWLEGLSGSWKNPSTEPLRRLLVAAIEPTLSQALGNLKGYAEGAASESALGQPLGTSFKGFLSLWHLASVKPDPSIYRGPNRTRKIDHALAPVGLVFATFLGTIREIQPATQALLQATLTEANHKPQIALYAAFIKLFGTAQNTVNSMSNRYLEFYYRDLLHEKPAGPIPDQVYLTFGLAASEEVTRATVPRGTLFPAGQDAEDRTILYGADHDLVVTSATLAKVRTVRVLNGPLYQPAAALPASAGLQAICRILQTEIELPPPGSAAAPVTADGTPSGWATFGPALVRESPTEQTKPAELGFGIATDVLWLTGGTRIIKLEIGYSQAFQEELDLWLAAVALATGCPPDDILEQIWLAAFTLYLTSETGWFTVESYQVNPTAITDAGQPACKLIVTLPPTAPGVAAYQTDPAEADTTTVSLDPTFPTLKAVLRQEPVTISGSQGTVTVYPLSFLDRLPVTSLKVHATVTDLAGLQISNTDGEIDPAEPFAVFGGNPVVGSYLQVRHDELFAKTLNTLGLSISWFNLPLNEAGFKEYYRDYVIGPDGQFNLRLFTNAVFAGEIAVVTPGNWQLADPATGQPVAQVGEWLFRTRPDCTLVPPPPIGPLCTTTAFENLTVVASTPPLYYKPADSAVRFKLTAPAYTFGNSIYAQNVLNAIIQDLPTQDLPPQSGPTPAECEETCQNKSQVLLQAAACIENCLQCLAAYPQFPCADEPNSIQKFLAECLTCLLMVSFQCLEQCLPKAVALPPEDALSQLQARLKAAGVLAPEEQLHLVEQAHQECRALLRQGGFSPQVRFCLEKCLLLLDIFLSVWNSIVPYEKTALANVANLQIGLEACRPTISPELWTCLEAALKNNLLSDPRCLAEAMETCLTTVVRTAPQRLEECLPKVLGSPVEADFQLLLARMRATSPTISAARTEAMRQRLSECRELRAGPYTPALLKLCLERFVQSLESYLCVEKCLAVFLNQSTSNLETLKTALSACHTQTLETYADYYKRCVLKCLKQKDLKYPNEPYLPLATSVAVNYTALCEWSAATSLPVGLRFYHLLPFGGYRRVEPATELPFYLLPQFAYAGNAYYGFSSLPVPETLTLLFEMSGSANETAADGLPPVQWATLAENRWAPFLPAQVRRDTTNGLQNTGITALAIPTQTTLANTVLEREYRWLRAAVASGAGAFPRTINLTPNVLTATWQAGDGTGETLRQPLAAGTITASVQDLPDIAEISQPLASYGGRAPETVEEFRLRLSERLRHKERALLGWDYERLVLERFPTIWKTQTLPARNLQHGNAPGEVLVVVVPGSESREIQDPTVPTAPSEMLKRIQSYLAERTSLFVKLAVVNPVYVRIQVTATVLFRGETEAGDLIKKLNQDLIGYLSPWFYDADRAARGGRYAAEADITEFILTRPYVEAVDSLSFTYDPPGYHRLDWYFLTSAERHVLSDWQQPVNPAPAGY
ncbi:MAG: baseplate J/gp47 family protein [Blastocatellia bacterium]|nr:baseplate J/gp47 family protein [Blastocatellia bacterium]